MEATGYSARPKVQQKQIEREFDQRVQILNKGKGVGVLANQYQWDRKKYKAQRPPTPSVSEEPTVPAGRVREEPSIEEPTITEPAIPMVGEKELRAKAKQLGLSVETLKKAELVFEKIKEAGDTKLLRAIMALISKGEKWDKILEYDEVKAYLEQ